MREPQARTTLFYRVTLVGLLTSLNFSILLGEELTMKLMYKEEHEDKASLANNDMFHGTK